MQADNQIIYYTFKTILLPILPTSKSQPAGAEFLEPHKIKQVHSRQREKESEDKE